MLSVSKLSIDYGSNRVVSELDLALECTRIHVARFPYFFFNALNPLYFLSAAVVSIVNDLIAFLV